MTINFGLKVQNINKVNIDEHIYVYAATLQPMERGVV